jgi:hypothetical protein
MENFSSQSKVTWIAALISLVGIAISLFAGLILIWQVFLNGEYHSIEHLMKRLFSSSLVALLVLTLCWLEALFRISRIIKDSAWRDWYVGSTGTIKHSRSWLLGLIAWTATSLAVFAISDFSAAIVIPSTFLIFGVSSFLLERSIYRRFQT